jgi:hypothetical protein
MRRFAAAGAGSAGLQFRPLERVPGAMGAERPRAEGVAALGFLNSLPQLARVFGREKAGVGHFARHQAAFSCSAARCPGVSLSAIARAMTSGRDSTVL